MIFAYLCLLAPEFFSDLQTTFMELDFLSTLSSWTSFKLLMFFSQLLQDKIPSRENLLKRGIFLVSKDVSYSLCLESLQSSSHLFVTCEVVAHVWYKIFSWLGWWVVLHRYLSTLFQMFFLLCGVSTIMRLFYDLTCSGLVEFERPK